MVEKKVARHIVKSKTVTKGGVEVTMEVRLPDSATQFVNDLSNIPGVTAATLVSYNGEYMA